MALSPTYTRLIDYTLPAISGSHTDLVMLLKYDDFNVGDALNFIDNGGGDLRFSSDEAGNNQLPCEVVQFDKVGLSAQVWVKAPNASTGQVIYIWGDKTGDSQPAVTDPYGRNAVWSDYEAVLHMQEVGTNGVFVDSTGNGHDTTLTTGSSLPTTTVNHPFGGSWPDFTSHGITLSNSAQMLNNSAIHMSAIVNDDVTSPNDGLLGNRYQTFSDSNWFSMQASTRVLVKASGAEDAHLGAIFAKPTNYLTATHDATSLQSFLNGQLDGEDTTIAATGGITSQVGQDYRIGTYYDNSSARRYNGRVGEVRLAKYKPSPSRVTTEYNNQSSVGAWGAPTRASGGAVTYTLTLNPLTATTSFSDLQLSHNKLLTLNSLSGTGSFSDLQFNHNKRLTLNPLSGSGNWSTLNLNYTSSATTYALTLSSLVGSGSLNQIKLSHHKKLTLNNVSGNGQFDDVALNYNRKLSLNSLSGSGDFNQLQLLHNKSLSINALTGSGGFSAIQLNWSGLVEQKIDTYTVSYAPSPISVSYSNDLITVQFKE